MTQTLRLMARNLLGDRLATRTVVFESDDWGSQRMPDPSSLAALEKVAGIGLNEFDRNDCIESCGDVECLAEILSAKYYGKRRSIPFTFNFVMRNPDFAGIRESGFEEYRSIDLPESYENANAGNVLGLIGVLKSEGLALPQFHCLEHLNVSLWMKDLLAATGSIRSAFELGYFAQMQNTSCPFQNHYLAAYHAVSETDLEDKKNRLIEGLAAFERVFGFRSSTMIPCNYIFPRELQAELPKYDVKGIQGAPVMKVPVVKKQGRIKRKRRFFRRKAFPQHLVRNVRFEPYEGAVQDPVTSALCEIAIAFRFGRPAIISTHRVNYVSGLSHSNRDRSLQLLSELIRQIVKNWPDAEFRTSDELLM